MKIAAHVAVKDEVELFPLCIEHLRRIGVTQFIVCDMQSTDGTAERAEAMSSETFRVLHSSNAEYGNDWLKWNADVIREVGADWTICHDADEFLLPVGGDLAPYLTSSTADLISVPRYNVPLGRNGLLMPERLTADRHGEVELIVEPIPDFRRHLAENDDMPWIRAVPMPKIVVRTEKLGRLTDGMHAALGLDGRPLPAVQLPGLLVAHVPFSTRERFVRKVENIREVMTRHDAHFGPNKAWHWRRWLEQADRGQIDAEFDRTVFSDETIAELRATGVVRTAADMLGTG